MLGDPALREAFLEKEHLHELLAKNTWIFGEAYNLTVNEGSLTEVVRKHVIAAGLPVVVDEPILQTDGRSGRVDLMLTRAMGAHAHSREHVVVELKRPSVAGGEEVIRQTIRYARAIAADPRWADTNTTWTFWAVTYDLDEYGQGQMKLRDRPRGQLEKGDNYTVWLRTWGQLFEDCRARMQFLRDALELQTRNEVGVRHLQTAYPAHMPVIVEESEPDGSAHLRAVKRTRAARSMTTKAKRSKR